MSIIKLETKCPCGCDEINYKFAICGFGLWYFEDHGYWWFRLLINTKWFRGYVGYSNIQGWHKFNYNNLFW